MNCKPGAPRKTIGRTDPAGAQASRLMQWVAWLMIAIGAGLIAANASDFGDRDLGSMVGVGFVIAGMLIFGAGMFVHLLDSEFRQGPRTDP